MRWLQIRNVTWSQTFRCFANRWYFKNFWKDFSSLKLTQDVFRDIDKVDDLMQDITEQRELAQEISDAISKPVGFGEEFDDVGADDFFFLAFDFIWIPSCSYATLNKLLSTFFNSFLYFYTWSKGYLDFLVMWHTHRWLRSCTLAIVSSEQSIVSKLFVKFLMRWFQVLNYHLRIQLQARIKVRDEP